MEIKFNNKEIRDLLILLDWYIPFMAHFNREESEKYFDIRRRLNYKIK